MVNTNDKWQSIIGVQKIKGTIFKPVLSRNLLHVVCQQYH